MRRWYWSMMGFDPKALGRVYNVALLVAQVIAREDQAGAVALFDKLTSSNPFVRLTFGLARVSLDAMSVWNAWDGDEMRKLRFKRLDQARTDHDLAMEVLAATRAGKQEHLRDFVLDRRERPEPAHIARAITVAGLCEDTLWALETIDAHKADCGFLGEAYHTAKYSMDRLRWSKHWATLMRDATTEVDLWRYAILLTTIVDGRFSGAEVQNSSSGELIKRFGPTFEDLRRRRIGKWKEKRSKTLFGMEAPDEIFLA